MYVGRGSSLMFKSCKSVLLKKPLAPFVLFSYKTFMPRTLSRLILLVLLLLCASACNTTPTAPALSTATMPPEPTLTPTRSEPTSTPAADASPDEISKAVIADWEEMFRTMSTYEYVSTEGKPGDKTWWTTQAQRFYTGQALATQLERIDFMFSPRSVGQSPGFIENAHYTVKLVTCSSDTECELDIQMQSGKFWTYEVHYKKWGEANTIETPFSLKASMQYDPTKDRWKIK